MYMYMHMQGGESPTATGTSEDDKAKDSLHGEVPPGPFNVVPFWVCYG